MNAERDALAYIIWATSRADEGTISATGANHIADALLSAGWTRTTDNPTDECPAWAYGTCRCRTQCPDDRAALDTPTPDKENT